MDLIALFLDKIVTEKNLSNASIVSYKSDLKLFHKFLKENKENFLTCNEETVKKRLVIYHEQTSPLVDFYKKSSLVQNGNKYIEVNGVGDISTIQEQIKKAL